MREMPHGFYKKGVAPIPSGKRRAFLNIYPGRGDVGGALEAKDVMTWNAKAESQVQQEHARLSCHHDLIPSLGSFFNGVPLPRRI
jgi:hypothetical protein